jgi:hypothetical protein
MEKLIETIQCEEFQRDMDTAFCVAGYVMCAVVVLIFGGAL